MKTLQVFETMNGEWCAGTTSLDSVWADTKEDALKKWRQNNPKKRVRTNNHKFHIHGYSVVGEI